MSFNKKFFTTGGIVASSPPAAPVNPLENFAPVLYTGNSTNDQSITGVGFKPDFVWIKSRNTGTGTTYHGLWDSVRGTGGQLYSSITNAETNTPNRLYSFDSDGFSLGNGVDPEYIGNKDYVAWCWKAADTTTTIAANTVGNTIASDVRANTGAGFSIVKWAGETAIDTIGHGLSSPPELILIKSLDVSANWQVYAEPLGNAEKLVLDLSDAAGNTTRFDSTSPTSSVFTYRDVGIGGDQVAYCFHSVNGYQKVGSYSGSHPTRQTIETGFQPRFVMIKRTDDSRDWVIFDSQRYQNNQYDAYLAANTNATEAYMPNLSNYTVEFLSNGFSVQDGSFVNLTGGTYIYLAIA